MEAESLSQLSYDFSQILENGENYDMIIKVGTGDDAKDIKAHSVILCARSSYFRAALSKNWVHKENGIIKYTKPNILPRVFNFILKYLYTGKLDFKSYEPVDLLLILVAADEMNIQELHKYLKEYLIDNYQTFLQLDSVHILQIIFQYEACSILKDHCLDFICENPKLLFDSENYLSLNKNILLLFLNRDNLYMSEVEIWNYLIKWSVAQVSTSLNLENISTWSSEELSSVKEIISNFVKLIRWLEISSVQFKKNVIPFKKVLPEDLFMEIICYYLDPKTELTIPVLPARNALSEPLDSVLINHKHLSVISGWIDQKDYNHSKIPYSFNLLLRASRDGFDVKKFHELCDYKGATLVIISLPNYKNIIGGYNPIDWKPLSNHKYDNHWWKTSKSFLFSLTKDNSKGMVSQIARVSDSQYQFDRAILYNKKNGPCFGHGPDLAIYSNNQMSSNHYSYPDSKFFIPSGIMGIENYEIFQILKKE